MTDLTEQWKKGELPFGYYYVKFLNGENGVKKLGEFAYRKLIGEVIDIVPSYEEWKEIEKRSWLVPEFDNEIDELNDTIEELKKENTQLKELLKECQAKLNYCTRETYELQTKINQALGEDK